LNESRASRYQRLRRRAGVVNAAAAAAVLAACVWSPLGSALAEVSRAATRSLPSPLRSSAEVVVFVAILAASLELLALPVVLYLDAKRRRPTAVRSDAETRRLVSVQLQEAVVGVAAAAVVGVTVHAAARLAGPFWWALSGMVFAGLLAFAARGISSVIARSGAAAPMPAGSLRTRLEQVAASAAVPVAGLFEWTVDERADHSASVTGYGRGRRILVSPALLRDWSEDEIAVVVAHELSHHKHHDLLQTLALDGLLLSSALAGAALAVHAAGVAPGELESLPLIAVVAGAIWIAVTPARHALSRWQERRADQFALVLTGHAEAFGAAVRRIGERQLIEDRPSPVTRWLFHRHPTIHERLAMAEAFSGQRAEGKGHRYR
jgi:STE24 endopeptidase